MQKREEEYCRKGIARRHPLGMTLHGDDPMLVRFMLDGLDHSIGCNRSNPQAVSKIPDGLMMRSVYLSIESAAAMREAASGRELSNFAAGLAPGRLNRVVRSEERRVGNARRSRWC